MSDKRIPPVPKLPQLTWLLFMQPFQIHWLLREWGFQDDPSLLRLWPRIKAQDPIVLTLLKQWAWLLFVWAPIPTVAIVLAWLDTYLTLSDVMVGVMVRVMVGVVAGVVFAVAGGVVAVMVGMVFGMAAGVAFGTAFGVMAMCFSWAHSEAEGMTARMIAYVTFLLVGGAAFGAARGAARGVAASVSRVTNHWGLVFEPGAASFSLLLYPLEALITLLISRQARLQPERSITMTRWLPFRHHDLIYFPLPGLNSFLVQLAVIDPVLTKNLLAEASASIGQKGVASRTLIELQARDLELAARNRLYARAADLDFPFLPSVDALDSSSPLLFFQSAARELCIDSDYHQRHRALERARRTLESFITIRVGSNSSFPELSNRLLSTARLWLDVVQDEERKLATDEALRPQVPRAFVAGAPLTPEDPKNHLLFKGRTDLVQIIKHDLTPDRCGILVIAGQRRMGKSSFRNWLPRLLGAGTDILVANFQELSGHPHRATPHRCILDLITDHLAHPPPPASPHWTNALDWLRACDASLSNRTLLVVIDEVERVQDGISAGWCTTDFLDFLRAAGDALKKIRFLLLTAYPLYRLGHHWVDRLISSTSRSISYLDTMSAEELARSPIDGFPDIYPKGGVERILQETRCHPFLIQKVCDELCKYLNENGGRRRATDEELTEVIERVADEKLFDELWHQRTLEEKRALHRLAFATTALDAGPAMRQLAREGYVELHDEHATIAVPLFGRWIRFTQGRTPL